MPLIAFRVSIVLDCLSEESIEHAVFFSSSIISCMGFCWEGAPGGPWDLSVIRGFVEDFLKWDEEWGRKVVFKSIDYLVYESSWKFFD